MADYAHFAAAAPERGAMISIVAHRKRYDAHTGQRKRFGRAELKRLVDYNAYVLLPHPHGARSASFEIACARGPRRAVRVEARR